MWHADQLLDDNFLSIVGKRWARAVHCRAGPAQVVVGLLILKPVRNWSLRLLDGEVHQCAMPPFQAQAARRHHVCLRFRFLIAKVFIAA